MSKQTFIMRTSYEEIFASLSDQQAGLLIKSILSYAHRQTGVKLNDPALHMAWRFIKQDIDYDKQKYDDVCAKRRDIALARWKSIKQSDKRGKKRGAAH